MNRNSRVIYRGPSMLDGAPLVVLAVGLSAGSSNRKTGDMLQTYILRADVAPTEAIKTGADSSICGMCPHRGDVVTGGQAGKGRTCYVNVGQGALSAWRSWQRGDVEACAMAPDARDWRPEVDRIADCGAGRVVRLGTYGDPAAVPAHVWEALTSRAVAYTGYTHQWRAIGAGLQRFCMASADSEADAVEARAAGWRTFRVAMPCDVERMPGEAICPASAEAGKKLTCEQCRACGGTAGGRRGSIVIKAHGGFAVMANVARRAA